MMRPHHSIFFKCFVGGLLAKHFYDCMERNLVYGYFSHSNWIHLVLCGDTKKGPAWAAAFIYLVPSMTANLDMIFFGANFTFSMVLGTTFVVAGLFVGNLSQQQFERVKSFLSVKS